MKTTTIRIIRYPFLLVVVASSLFVGCATGTPDHLNPFVERLTLLKKLKEMNDYSAQGDTISIRTYKDDRYTLTRFSIDILEARGVLLSTRLNDTNKLSEYTVVDSVITIPRGDIFSVKVHYHSTVTTTGLAFGGFALGAVSGYLAAFLVDADRSFEGRNALSASTYHIAALVSGVIFSASALSTKNDDHNIYYYFCPNDNCESIKRDLDRIHLDGRTTW